MPYSGNPANSTLDAIRFYAQDTGNPPLLSDNEVTYLLNLFTPLNGGDPMLCGAYVADIIANRFASEVSISADGVTYSGEQLQQKYQAVAKSLRDSYREIAGMNAPAPYVGGILYEDYPAPGTRPPNFGIGAADNARAGREFYGNRGEWIDNAALLDEASESDEYP